MRLPALPSGALSLAYMSLVSVLLCHTPANAQPTANMWWEVQTADGWQRGDVTTSQSSITVRRMAIFDDGTLLAFFGWTLFDPTIYSPAGAMDTASQFVLPSRLITVGWTRFAVFRFGQTLKIDVETDSAPPGLGNRWVAPYQDYDRASPFVDNPIELFRYTLTFDRSVLGLRTLSQVQGLITDFGANTTDRCLRIHGGELRLPILPLTTLDDARINFIPTPSASLVTSVFVIFASRRRR
jgi:hypothetical protein